MMPTSLTVSVDHEQHEVRLTGSAGSEITLGWVQAANLASILNEASRLAAPNARPGKAYQPTIGRYG